MDLDKYICLQDDDNAECVEDYDFDKGGNQRESKEGGLNNASTPRDRNAQRVLSRYEKSNANDDSLSRRWSRRRVSSDKAVNVSRLLRPSTRRLVITSPPTREAQQ